jgi:hypothetical protein
MQIHHDMYGYWNAVWGAPATQADGPAGARWASADGGANGAPVTQNAPEDAAHTGGGNPILQALAQALESLGLSLSAPPNSTSADSASSPNASTTATTSATPAATTTAVSSAPAPALAPAPAPNHEISSEERTIAGDVRHLMHALFEDVRAENLLAPSAGSASASSTSGSSFASGLAALISQVQSGSAPANLQRAFDSLVANLSQVGTQSAPAVASDSPPAASAVAPASTLNTQALLVQFLTNLQTDLGLGYGGSTGTPAQSATSGVMVNAAA